MPRFFNNEIHIDQHDNNISGNGRSNTNHKYGNRNFCSKNSNGFTLVELSVVLVIIGLIVSGVLIGRFLLENAKVNNTISQIRDYETAVNLFVLKYGGLPGDLRMDAEFGFDPVTSNQKGNGLLTSDESNDENIKFWRHLSQAALIDGSFNGTNTKYGEGAPLTALNKVGMYVASGINLFPQRNVFILGLDEVDPNAYHLIPVNSWQIDNKMDDGYPTNGLVRTPNAGFSPYCYLEGLVPVDEYNLTYNVGLCALFVRTSF